jgi:hypothetical protein
MTANLTALFADVRYILGQNAGTGGYITSLQLYVDGGNAKAFLRDDDNQSVTLAGAKVDDGQWHYVVLTIDGGNVTLSVDVTDAASGANALDKYTAWDHDMPVMAFNNRGTLGGFFTGDLDDLVILNYPMSREEMAQAYFDVTGEHSCLYAEKPELAYDFDGHCRIDLTDFAMLAEKWAESGLYPLQ